MNYSQQQVEKAYNSMLVIRRLEERMLTLAADGLVQGSVHPSLGQEAIPVGALAGLAPQDRVVASYRGHGWALACGSTPVATLAEITQRAGGLNGGRAGSPMLSDPDNGFLGETSIVGAGVPIGAGVALASQYQETNRVVVVSIGDGAMNQGATTEGMVFAASKNLPLIIVCENNGWAEMTPSDAMVRNGDLTARAAALGIIAHHVDGNDPFAVEEAIRVAAESCRKGEGPVFLECKTVRLGGHYNRDIQHYRPREDSELAADQEPIRRMQLSGVIPDEARLAIEENVARLIDEAVEVALGMPLPDPATVLDHLYAQARAVADSFSSTPDVRELTYQRAVNLALATELEERPEVVVYGEDVGFAGGIFGVTRGLQKRFGVNRVFDTPISESAILGSAIGASMEGMRPVVEIMWADFVFVALDQIVNQASNVRYINRSKISAPITVRMQQGVTPGSCAQHSQSIEAVLAHIPGIKVGLAATPQDAYSMTRAAIADDDPTVLIESRSLYFNTGDVNVTGLPERAEGARLAREGDSLALITWGAMLSECLQAAEMLAEYGISASVLDLRWLRPLDEAAIDRVVTACGGRAAVVHEATTTGGFGAEIAAGLWERGSAMGGQIIRIGTPDVRMPSAPNLQSAVVPRAESIAAQVREAFGQLGQP